MDRNNNDIKTTVCENISGGVHRLGKDIMIKLEHVSVRIQGQEILTDINLNIEDGEFVLICGDSGCGKTTMTKLINGLIPHFVKDAEVTGSVTVSGKNVAGTEMYEMAEIVGSVFQNPKTQFFHTNSSAEMAFGLENRGDRPETIRKRVSETVRELDIENLSDRNVFAMSGGEKQLLAFASVYAMNPEVYVLDEPSANLDAVGIEKLCRRLEVIKREGHMVVVAEHRLAWLMPLADRVLYMRAGRIEREFSKDEFMNLSDDERTSMGLRSIHMEEIEIPEFLKVDRNINSRNIKNGSKDEKSCVHRECSGNAAELVVHDLSCRRKKKEIFAGISFAANAGDIIGIIGRNGAGKSTFCNVLCGLLKEKSGEITYKGRKLEKRARTKLFGMVMQDVNHQLFSDSVKNECLLADEDATDEQISELLAGFDLAEFAENHPMTLSGGQRQRLAVCQAVMGGKRLLIFDEPTSGLDYRHMCQVGELLRKLAADGHIILVVTHDYEFLNKTCDGYIRIDR